MYKVVTSSGTTAGAEVSRIYLDAAAAQLQTRTLAGIMTHWLGPARLPMIVVDARSTVRDRRTFSARAAGIIGMSTFGRDHFYALDDDMRLDRDGLARVAGQAHGLTDPRLRLHVHGLGAPAAAPSVPARSICATAS